MRESETLQFCVGSSEKLLGSSFRENVASRIINNGDMAGVRIVEHRGERARLLDVPSERRTIVTL